MVLAAHQVLDLLVLQIDLLAQFLLLSLEYQGCQMVQVGLGCQDFLSFQAFLVIHPSLVDLVVLFALEVLLNQAVPFHPLFQEIQLDQVALDLPCLLACPGIHLVPAFLWVQESLVDLGSPCLLLVRVFH